LKFLYNGWVKSENKLKYSFNNKKEKEQIQTSTNSFVDIMITKIDERFPHDIVDDIISIFKPSIMYNWDENRKIYGKIIKLFKNRFSIFRYKQKYEDFEMFKNIIKKSLNTLKTFKEVCLFIIHNHQFAEAVTLVFLAQVSLLLNPTTAIVESNFSMLNDVHDENRNRLSIKFLNMIMMIKNVSAEETESLLWNAAVNWIKDIKKRKHMKSVMWMLYKEGQLPFLPNCRMLSWKEENQIEEYPEKEKLQKDYIHLTAIYKMTKEIINLEKSYPENNEDSESENECKKTLILNQNKEISKYDEEDDDNDDEYENELKVIQMIKKKR
jgi:hypothetical protein